MGLPNTSPVHVGTPKSWIYDIAGTANTNRDGTGTISDITPPAAAGKQSLGAKLKITAKVTTTAGMVRIYGHDGTAYKLMHELTVEALTVSATVKGAVAGKADGVLDTQGYMTLNLPFGDTVAGTIQKIGVSTHNAEAFVAHWIGDGDFQ
jgi:hypothetical protein